MYIEELCYSNWRGKMENFIKEGKEGFGFCAVSSSTKVVNANRLQLHTLAYNLFNWFRRLALAAKMRKLRTASSCASVRSVLLTFSRIAYLQSLSSQALYRSGDANPLSPRRYRGRDGYFSIEKPAGQMIFLYTFIVTAMESEPYQVIRFYCGRGKMENFIKEGKEGFGGYLFNLGYKEKWEKENNYPELFMEPQ